MIKNSLFIFLVSTMLLSAQTLIWDTVSNGTTIDHNDGTWNLSNSNWNNGTTNQIWVNSPTSIAKLSGTSATVPYIAIGSDAISAATITFNGSGTSVLEGNFANLTADTLNISTTGGGKLALISNGTLANIGTINISNGSTLFMSNSQIINTNLNLSGTGNTENRGALRVEKSAKLLGTMTLLADSTFGTNSGVSIIESAISGNFSLTQAAISGATTRFTGNNTYSGGTNINKGTIQLGHNNALGTGLINLSGGTLSSDSATARTIPNAVTITGVISLGNSTNSGKLTFTDPATVNGAALSINSAVEFTTVNVSGDIALAGSTPLTIGASIVSRTSDTSIGGSAFATTASGITIDTGSFETSITSSITGPGGITKNGSATLSMGGENSTFIGPIVVNQGSLEITPSIDLPADLQIYPSGDSITYGSGGPGGYRLPLYNLLEPIAPNFKYVGDSTENPGTLPLDQHQSGGHASYSTSDIHNNLDGLDTATFDQYGGAQRNPNGGYWFTGGNDTGRDPLFPDVILLLVGTNDVFRLNLSDQQAHDSYTALIEKIHTLRPAAHIFMSKITPSDNNNQRTIDYNVIVEQVYNEQVLLGRKVTLVDLHTGYTGGWIDNVHPSPAGYQWMAGIWYQSLVSILGDLRPTDLRNASSVTIASGASLLGTALTGDLDIQGAIAPGNTTVPLGSFTSDDTTISGTYACDISSTTADLLQVQGDLTLSSATLALNTLEAPTAPFIPIISYTGNYTGNFTTVTGLPAGYTLVHDPILKRLLIATSYGKWRAENTLSDPDTGFAIDTDTNSITDILEFAIGGNPNVSTDRGTYMGEFAQTGNPPVFTLTIATRAGATFAAQANNTHTATKDGVTYTIESSLDLSTWNVAITEIPPATGSLPALPAGYEYHTFKATTHAAITRSFIRLKVTPNP